MIDTLIIVATIAGFGALAYVIVDMWRFSRDEERLRQERLRNSERYSGRASSGSVD